MLILCIVLVLIFTARGQKEGDECVDQFTNAAGICKLFSECETAKQDLLQSGIKPTYCSHATFGHTIACCRDGLTILETPSSEGRSGDLPTWGLATQPKRRITEKKCEEYSKAVIQKVEYLLLLQQPYFFSLHYDTCSTRPPSPTSGFAQTGEFPHMAAIGWYHDTSQKYDFKCGGSLISDRFVLTVAHCQVDSFTRDMPTFVRLGDQNLEDSVNDGVQPIDVPIKKFHSHPDYQPPKKYNDIGLIELSARVVFTSNIRPACLWPRAELPTDQLMVTGWSVLNPNISLAERQLSKAQIKLLDKEGCDVLNKNRHWKGLNESQICAGETNTKWDSCLNESGSPLQITTKRSKCVYHIVGITSFGFKCKQYDRPAVYTRVSSYLDWIEGIVWADEE